MHGSRLERGEYEGSASVSGGNLYGSNPDSDLCRRRAISACQTRDAGGLEYHAEHAVTPMRFAKDTIISAGSGERRRASANDARVDVQLCSPE